MTEIVRYCTECGSIGEVPEGKRDCCPDGNLACRVPITVAEQARLGFQYGISEFKESLVLTQLRKEIARLKYDISLATDDIIHLEERRTY